MVVTIRIRFCPGKRKLPVVARRGDSRRPICQSLKRGIGQRTGKLALSVCEARHFYWTARSHFTMCGKGFTPRKRAFGSSKAISHACSSGKPM